MNTHHGRSDGVRVSGGHLCVQHRSTDRGGSRDLEPMATTCGARNSLLAQGDRYNPNPPENGSF